MSYNNGFSSTGALLTGALIAGGVALLASPQTGARFRNQLRSLAGRAGGEMAKSMANRLNTAMERGIEYAERGQEVLREASQAMDNAIERGKEYLESGKGMVNTLGRNQDSGWNRNGFATAGALLAGVLVGGGLALLMTPQTGPQFRRQIKTYAGKMKTYTDKATEKVKDKIAMVREK